MEQQAKDQAVTPAAVDDAPVPHPSSSDNAAGPGITAPSALAREAFDRLAKGERPESINRDLYQQPTVTPTAEKQPPSPPPQPTQPDQQQSEAPPQPAPQWPEGMDAKDRNVLKRAQMDPETWAAIPPSNQKKILANLRSSQAAADRAFQQRRQQEATSGKLPSDEPPTQTDPEAPDEPTPIDPEDQQPLDAAQRTPAIAPVPAQPTSDELSAFLDPKDLETLELIGGKELAETYRSGIGRVVQHFTQQNQQLQQQNSQLVNVATFLLEQHVEQQFNSGLDELTKQPGLENLRDESRTTEREALRRKADLLHRAAGDPKGYPYQEAMRDAAASLFKTSIHQTSQARLLTSRSQSLQGSPDRGDGRQNAPRELSARERNAAIYANLAKGMSPEEARRAVDGS